MIEQTLSHLLTSWTINLASVIALTTITGSVAMCIWLLLEKVLVGKGYTRELFVMLEAVVFFYLVPISYGLLVVMSKGNMRRSYSYLFAPTPVLLFVSRIICVVWIVGAVIFAKTWIRKRRFITYISRNCFDCSSMEQEVFDRVCADMKIKFHKVKVFKVRCVESPMIYGIIKPQIVLPDRNYSEEQLSVIFTHELTHYKQKDIILKHLSLLILFLYYFNPLTRILLKRVEQYSEYACDYGVYKYIGSIKKYCSVLVDVMSDDSRDSIYASYLSENAEKLRERMEYMSRNKIRKSGIKTAVLFAACVVLGTSTVSAATIGMADGYVDMYKITEVADEEELQTELIEYTELGNADSITVYEDEVNNMARSAYAFEWNLEGYSMVTSGQIYLKSGSTVGIMAQTDPKNKEYKLGVMDSSGRKTYVYATGVTSHTFDITSTGYYKIFAENPNDDAFYVEGTYLIP